MRQQRGIFTRKEMQAMPEVGHRFKYHRSCHGWPKVDDVTVLMSEVEYRVPPTRVITCRLECKKYTAGQANARYRELHAVPYDGRYVSGRYWVYWRRG